jgi:hypothetical protein
LLFWAQLPKKAGKHGSFDEASAAIGALRRKKSLHR